MPNEVVLDDNLQRWEPRRRRKPAIASEPRAAGMSEETAQILRIITVALRPFPEARLAVVEALQRAESQRS